MGWWEADSEGHSFAEGGGLLWGDRPADILGEALDEIDKEFEMNVGRKPTISELIAGIKFHAGGVDA